MLEQRIKFTLMHNWSRILVGAKEDLVDVQNDQWGLNGWHYRILLTKRYCQHCSEGMCFITVYRASIRICCVEQRISASQCDVTEPAVLSIFLEIRSCSSWAINGFSEFA